LFVYVITNSVNGKVYVGKTIAPEKRWAQHQSVAMAGKAGPLYDAIREEGAAAFEVSVVEECGSEDEAFDAERVWIDRLAATDPDHGFNRCIGGNGPSALGDHRYRHITAETCWELYSAGVAAPEIARRLGVASYQPIYRLLKRAGYPVRNAGRVRNAAAGHVLRDARDSHSPECRAALDSARGSS